MQLAPVDRLGLGALFSTRHPFVDQKKVFFADCPRTGPANINTVKRPTLRLPERPPVYIQLPDCRAQGPVLRSRLPQSGSTASFCAQRSYAFVPLYWDGAQDKKALPGVKRADVGQRSNPYPFYFEYYFLIRGGMACANQGGMKCRRVRAERHRHRRKGLRCPLSPEPYC